MIYLVEVQSHNGTSVVTRYFATEGYTSKPNDTPANQYYEPRLIDPGNFEQHMFSGSRTSGESAAGSGDILIATGDPGNGVTLDAFLGEAVDGRSVRILSVANADAALATAVVEFTGTAEQFLGGDVLSQASLKIHDRLKDLDKPLLTNRYGGTTISSGPTADGDLNLKDQLKQQVFGKAFNPSCALANAFDLIYQASDSAVLSIAVYDGGFALTAAGDFPTLLALQTASAVAIPPGSFGTCLALGLFRLGAIPFKTPTADVIEGATAANRTAAQIVRRALLAFGISASDLPAASFTALDAKNSAECGLLVTGEQTVLAFVAQVLDSVNGWCVPNSSGQFAVGRFEAPAVTAVATFSDADFLTSGGSSGGGISEVIIDDDDRGIPNSQAVVRHTRNWSPAGESDLVGVVSPAARPFFINEWRDESYPSVADPNTVTRWPNAKVLTRETCLASQAAATTEAVRLFALHSVPRDAYNFSVAPALAVGVTIGSTIAITSDRLRISGSKNFVVMSRIDERAQQTVTFEVWG